MTKNMAALVRQVTRFSHCNLNLFKNNTICCAIHRQLHVSGTQNLFHVIKMDIDNHLKTREETLKRIGGLKGAFRQKVEEYLDKSETNAIFKADLLTMLQVTETEEDLQTLKKMIIRHNKYPINFSFGPILARTLYHLDKPGLAFELLIGSETKAIFTDTTSYMVIMDLLFERGMMEECIKVYDTFIEEKNLFVNQDTFALYTAALAKLGNKEALDRAVAAIKERRENNLFYTNRTVGYCTYLAIKQGRPDLAADFLNEELRPLRKQDIYNKISKTGILRNLQIMCQAQLGDLKGALDTLQSFLGSEERGEAEAVFQETFKIVEEAVQQSEELIIKDRFDQIKRFVNGKLFATVKIDDIMFIPIYPNRKIRSQNIRMKRRSGRLGDDNRNSLPETEYNM